MKMMLLSGLMLGLSLNANAIGYTCSNQEGTKVRVQHLRFSWVHVTKNGVTTKFNYDFNENLTDFDGNILGSFKIAPIEIPIDFGKCGRTRIGCPDPRTVYTGTLILNNEAPEVLGCSPY